MDLIPQTIYNDLGVYRVYHYRESKTVCSFKWFVPPPIRPAVWCLELTEHRDRRPSQAFDAHAAFYHNAIMHILQSFQELIGDWQADEARKKRARWRKRMKKLVE